MERQAKPPQVPACGVTCIWNEMWMERDLRNIEPDPVVLNLVIVPHQGVDRVLVEYISDFQTNLIRSAGQGSGEAINFGSVYGKGVHNILFK